MKTVYFDNKTNEIFKKIKEKEPNFNFSNFVADSLANYIQEGDKGLDPDLINDKLNKLKATRREVEDNLKYWEAKNQKYLINVEMKKEREKEEEQNEEIQKQKEMERERNIRETFKEEMNREMKDFEYDEYIKEGKSIWKFCDMLKERVEKNDSP